VLIERRIRIDTGETSELRFDFIQDIEAGEVFTVNVTARDDGGNIVTGDSITNFSFELPYQGFNFGFANNVNVTPLPTGGERAIISLTNGRANFPISAITESGIYSAVANVIDNTNIDVTYTPSLGATSQKTEQLTFTVIHTNPFQIRLEEKSKTNHPYGELSRLEETEEVTLTATLLDRFYNRVYTLNPLHNAQDADFVISLATTGDATLSADNLSLTQGYGEFTVTNETVETIHVTTHFVSEDNSGLALDTLQTFVPIELSFEKLKPAIINNQFIPGVNNYISPLALHYSEAINDPDASVAAITLDDVAVDGNFELLPIIDTSTTTETTQVVFTPENMFELGRCYSINTEGSSLRGAAANDAVLAQSLSACAPQVYIEVPQHLYLLEGTTTSLNLLLDGQLDSNLLSGNAVVSRVENRNFNTLFDTQLFAVNDPQFNITLPTHTGTGLPDGQEVVVQISVANVNEQPQLVADEGVSNLEEAEPVNDFDTSNQQLKAGNNILFTILQVNGDFDGDGLPNGLELTLPGYDPTHIDSDGNGVNDGDEDIDADGLSNSQEVQANTQLLNGDSDNDGVSDFDEVIIHQTDPNLVDSDSDGISDFIEITSESDPTNDQEAFVDPFFITGMQVTPLSIIRDLAADTSPVQLVVTVTFENQGRVEVVDITQQSELLSFTSGNSQVATVNETGLISLVATGDTDVTIIFIENPELTATVSLSLTEVEPIIMEQEPNNSLAQAQNIDASFNRLYSPDIGDRTTNTSTIIPHVSIAGTGDNSYDYYQFTVSTVPALAIFDIDDANFDTYLRLYNEAGSLISSNDDASTSYGQGGSNSGLQSFLTYTFNTAGVYTLKVSRYSDNYINNGFSYTLHVSLERSADSDGDGIDDDWEVEHGLDKDDPSDALLDNDDDGLNNLEEFRHNTNPNMADTDSDGLNDAIEVNVANTNPLIGDTDGDSLSDFDEYYTLRTSPLFEDTDGDGVNDAEDTIDDWLYFFNGESIGDNFGRVVSDAGDVNNDGVIDVIVGAPNSDINGTNSGSATVFSGATGDALYHFNGDSAYNHLGSAVSGAGDVNNDGYADVIVSSKDNDADAEIAPGVAIVFSGADGSILHMLSSGSYNNDNFASSVSGAGDINNDGFADVIVGAPNARVDGSYVGSAIVFSGATGEVLHNFNGDAAYDGFGRAVGDAGDVDNDGFADVIVGAPNNSTHANNSGSATIFSGATGNVLHVFYGEYSNYSFGSSVSTAGDINNDGFADVIVGAPGEEYEGSELLGSLEDIQNLQTVQNSNGNATVFSGATGEVLYALSGDAAGDAFGYSVSDAGDVNNDGFVDVIVGAYGNDTNGRDSGSATIFSGVDGSTLLTISGQSISAELGFSVSGLGDINNDGYAEVIVGTTRNSARIIDVSGDWDGDGLTFSADLHPYIDNFLDSDGDGLVDLLELEIGTSINNPDTDGDSLSDFDEYHTLRTSPLFEDTDGDGITDAEDTIDDWLYFFNGESVGDDFGRVVSDAGDVNNDGVIDVIVGAPNSDINGTNSGSATIFSGATGDVLYHFNGDSSYDQLGSAVSDAGDVNNDGYADVIVSSKSDDLIDAIVGVAIIYSGADGSVLHMLSRPTYNNDNFASAISAAGDINNDGFADVIVGAPNARVEGTSVGSATIFSGATGEVLHIFYGDASYDSFGYAVSDAGDVNNDGVADVIVGSPESDINGGESGTAAVFSGATGDVIYRFFGESSEHFFGFSVSDAGDINNDGFADVMIGAPATSPETGEGAYSSRNPGSVTIYSGATGEVLHTLNGHSDYDSFGYSVSGIEDVNNDGFVDVIVGAPGTDTNGSSSGSASIFSGFDGTLLVTILGQNEQRELGFSVSGFGDVDNDEYPEVIVGTTGNTARIINVHTDWDGDGLIFSADPHPYMDDFLDSDGDGLVDLLELEIGTSINNTDTDGDSLSDFDEYHTLRTNPLLADTDGDGINDAEDTVDDWLYFFNGEDPNYEGGGGFGRSISDVGDINNDGIVDIIVGAPFNNKMGRRAGSATIISGASDEVLYQFYGESSYDQFGTSVSDAGDVNNDGVVDVIVGAPDNDTNGSNSGSVTIFSGASGAILYRFYGESAYDVFGEVVSGAGDVNNDGFADVIVGAKRNDHNGSDAGSATVFSGATGAILYRFYGENSSDYLGRSVSDVGDINNDGFADVIVGASGDDTNGNDAGSAIIFSGATGEALHQFYGAHSYYYFGSAVSAAGDVNNDGVVDIVIGAPGNGGDSGEVEGFQNTSEELQNTSEDRTLENTLNIRSNNGNATIYSGATGEILYSFNGDVSDSSFGYSVSGANDVNNDGFADIIVGSPYDINDSEGRATIFSGVDGSILLRISGQSEYAQLGLSVGALTDINGDGSSEVIVGTGNNTARIINVNGDWDGDGLILFEDPNPYVNDFLDSDGDGLLDVLELEIGTDINNIDTDGDTLTDFDEYYNLPSSPLFADTDGDGILDAEDTFNNTLHVFNGEVGGDNFGSAVSGAGDVNNDGVADIVIGAPNNDTNGTDSGSVTILSGSTSDILYRFYGESSGDNLGRVVSHAGDVNNDGHADIIVSSQREGEQTEGKIGTAIIFSGIDGSVLHRFSSGMSYSSDIFGSDVSAAGDVNNDGFADVIIGASRNNTNGTYAGSAAIYSGATGEILHSFYGAAYSYFGSAVSDAGDVNNDGVTDVIVGTVSSNGSATVYSGSTGEVLHQFLGGSSRNSFGRVVSDAGDINNDGFDDVIVGAPFDSTGAYQAGSVSIYSGATGDELYSFYGETSREYFGRSVSRANDVNNDGFADVIIGISGKNNNVGGSNSGEVIIISGSDGSTLLTISGQKAYAEIGIAVSDLGDINNDSHSEIIIGANNNEARIISVVINDNPLEEVEEPR